MDVVSPFGVDQDRNLSLQDRDQRFHVQIPFLPVGLLSVGFYLGHVFLGLDQRLTGQGRDPHPGRRCRSFPFGGCSQPHDQYRILFHHHLVDDGSGGLQYGTPPPDHVPIPRGHQRGRHAQLPGVGELGRVGFNGVFDPHSRNHGLRVFVDVTLAAPVAADSDVGPGRYHARHDHESLGIDDGMLFGDRHIRAHAVDLSVCHEDRRAPERRTGHGHDRGAPDGDPVPALEP